MCAFYICLDMGHVIDEIGHAIDPLNLKDIVSVTVINEVALCRIIRLNINRSVFLKMLWELIYIYIFFVMEDYGVLLFVFLLFFFVMEDYLICISIGFFLYLGPFFLLLETC